MGPASLWRRLTRGRLFDPDHPMPPGPVGSFVGLGILVALAVAISVPMYWMVVTAITPTGMTAKFPPDLFPSDPTLRNLQEILERRHFWNWVANSTFMAVVLTLATLVLGSMAGYAFAKIPFRGSKALFWLHIVAMMLPFEVILVPLFILVSRMGLVDTHAGLVVPLLASPFAVFLMKQFIQTLPTELMDSARIDGANEFQIYTLVVLPLIRAGLAFLGIITFVNTWNVFVWPLVVTRSSEMRTLQVGLALVREEVPLFYALHMAGAVIAAAPVVLVFFAFQRYFLRGVTVGAVKG